MISAWNLDGDQATRTVSWVMGLLADAIRDHRRPDPGPGVPGGRPGG
jgi:hypothetical protein